MPKPLYQNPTRPPAERPTDLRLEDKLAQAAQLIHNAQALIIAAGAGMGVDSGLPDFRSNNGFWRTYPALAQSRLRFEEAATAGHFIQHPERAWGFYGHRLQKYRTVQPHAGFCAALPAAQRPAPLPRLRRHRPAQCADVRRRGLEQPAQRPTT